MNTIRRGGRALTVITLIAGLLAAGFAAADQARPEPAPQTAPAEAAGQGVAVIAVVRARDLMSAADRQAYRRAMRQAGSAEARRSIREATLKTLGERAAEHGVIMVIDTRMMPMHERRYQSEPAPHPAVPPRAP